MSTWTTRASGKSRNYVVLQHKLKGANYSISGVKFRAGYAVVEKDSKVYRSLQQMPVLKGAKEFPLIFLRELPFITRSLDVKNVFGQEVYSHYLKELDILLKTEKKEVLVVEESKHLETKCSHRLASGQLCGNIAEEVSPSGYCVVHFLEDPKLEQMGIHIPRFLTRKEKISLKEKVKKTLIKVKEESKV